MSAIPKLPSADRRQSLRSRLQRALALSPSESEDPRSDSGLVAGDTTEEEVHQEQNDCPSPGDGAPPWAVSRKMLNLTGTRGQTLEALETPGQIDASANCTVIALQCIAE
ncbi:hypothetical protein N7523_010051 [Penicillium sp. IBT 18751x]|nr:hypothetical protein N7523_010051 [Penicillium sp. IBT 18751x]